jgi:hypothetical protein
LTVVVLFFHRRSTPRAVGSLFLTLVLIVLPVSTPRAVARGGGWGCRRSSVPFIVLLSTLRPGARRGGVGVGGAVSCLVSWERLGCSRRFLPRGYPTPWAP